MLRRKKKKAPLSLVLLALLLSGCVNIEVRYDAAPSPLDENHHTLLMEGDCGDGKSVRDMGQLGCSWGSDEAVKGTFTVHTPLPSVIKISSKDCDLEIADFHGETGGSFTYNFATGNKGGPIMPAGVKACILDVYVKWQTPPKMKPPEYELRGMTSRIYLRRRPPGVTAAQLRWLPEGRSSNGVTWGQFREVVARGESKAPSLRLELATKEQIANGSYRLFGCGMGIEKEAMTGDVVIHRDRLLGTQYKKGRCLYFGWATGTGISGAWVDTDAVLGAEVYGVGVQHLAANVTVKDGEICYETEKSVSLAVLNYGTTNKASGKTEACFSIPETGSARLGLFTQIGRAFYAIVEGGELKEIFQ